MFFRDWRMDTHARARGRRRYSRPKKEHAAKTVFSDVYMPSSDSVISHEPSIIKKKNVTRHDPRRVLGTKKHESRDHKLSTEVGRERLI